MDTETLQPLISVGVQLLAGALLLVGTAALARAYQYFGLQQNADARKVVEEALLNGIAYGRRKAIETAPTHAPEIGVVIRHAVDYVRDQVPGKLAQLKITEEQLPAKVEARIERQAGTAVTPPP